MDCSRWKVASDAGILAIKGIPICWGILLQPFLWVVQCSFWHCLGKKKNGTWSKNTCGAVTENCPLKTGIIFKIYTDDRIHYLNSCKRLQWGTKVLRHFHKMAPFWTVDLPIPFPFLPPPFPPKINVVFWALKSFFNFRQHWFGGWGDLWRLKGMK